MILVTALTCASSTLVDTQRQRTGSPRRCAAWTTAPRALRVT
jgi:hypothetical protein